MKFITLSSIIIGILVIFNLGGVLTPVTGGFTNLLTGDLTSDTDSGFNLFESSSLWIAILSIFSGAAIIGVRASFYGSSPSDSMLIAIATTLIAGYLITDLGAIASTLWAYGETWIRAITMAIFIPLTFIFISSLISWWRGSE